MKLVCEQSVLLGSARAPGSAAHTMRALALAACARGDSTLTRPADTPETRTFARALAMLGSPVRARAGCWHVRPCKGFPLPPDNVIPMGDAPRPLMMALGLSARIASGEAVLTGPPRLRGVSLDPLAAALNALGGRVRSTRANGCAPFTAGGPLRGGQVRVDTPSGDLLSALLLAVAGCPEETVIEAPGLRGVPEAGMTLGWLRAHGVAVEQEGWHTFRIPGGRCPGPVNAKIPGDFATAATLLAAGALGKNAVEVTGIDLADDQPEKAVVFGLREMGAQVTARAGCVGVGASPLRGAELDLGAAPAVLPLMAVLACFANGVSRLVNVPRTDNPDPVGVTAAGIRALGGSVRELDDGLEVTGAPMTGARVDCAGMAEVARAFLVAGSAIPGKTVIMGYEDAAGDCAACVGLVADLGGRLAPSDEPPQRGTMTGEKESADTWETTSS